MHVVTIVIFGSDGVGKSSLTMKYVQGIDLQQYDPTIEDSYRKHVEVDGMQVLLEIYDTAGTDKGTSFRDTHTKQGDGFVLIYSITKKSTFDDLAKFRQQIINLKEQSNVPMVLVGNMRDLEDQRAVSTEEGKALAEEWGAGFVEVSSKNKQDIDEVFNTLARQIVARFKESNTKAGDGGDEKNCLVC
ncbi:Ras- protein Rap-1A [Balamuthia mandrillaris]